MSWKLDLTGKSEAELDGGDCTPGWYLATLAETAEDEKGHQEFVYRITGPTFAGFAHREKLFHPELSTAKETGVQFLWKKTIATATRLGLIKAGDLGKTFDADWAKAVGWKGVICLVDDAYVAEGSGRLIHKNKLDFAPYPLDHPGIPPAERVRLGLALLPGQSLDAPEPAKKEPKKGKEAKTFAPSANGPTAEQQAKMLEGI